jgi:hypothetical protein
MAVPILTKARIPDDADGPEYVAKRNELESALAAIFGIEDGQNIEQAIFGTVAADGSFTLLRFSSDGAQAASSACGIVFQDGGVTKKLGLVNGKIELWQRTSENPEVWTLIYDYESVTGPKFKELEDVLVTTYTAEKIFKVNAEDANPRGLIAGDENAASQGYTTLYEMDDIGWAFQVAGQWAPVGSALAVDSTGNYLVPADLNNSLTYGAYLRAAPIEISLVDSVGNGTWTTVGPWTVGTGSTSTSLQTLGGKASAGVRLEKGIYRIRPSWVLRSGPGVGWFGWRLIGSGFSTHPKPSPYLYKKHMPRSFTQTADGNLTTKTETKLARTKAHELGAIMLIAPTQITVGLEAGCSTSGNNMQIEMAIERIV